MELPIEIAIVDDHILFRKGMAELLRIKPGFNVCCEAGDGEELIECLKSGISPDIILLDLKMPKMNGLECLAILSKKYPDIKVLILSMYDEKPFIMKAIKLGAKGYLLKDTEPDELFFAIDKVSNLGYYINQELSITLIKELSIQQEYSPALESGSINLNKIELEILKCICQGFTTQEIAQSVYRSERTVDGYRKKLIIKTGSKNSANLVAWAFRKGFID